MSTPVKAPARLARNPNGCTEAVMSHLTIAERKQLHQLAAQEMRTVSATIRMLVVQGLNRHQQEAMPCTPTPSASETTA